MLAIRALLCMLAFSIASAKADDEKTRARLGRVMWSAFQCSTFAEMSGNSQEQERLFGVGLKAGRQFIEAIQNGQVSSEAISSEVPIGVTMLLAGPSVDFIVGRIFESANGDAYDAIVKQDKTGLLLFDDEARKMKAEDRYHGSNCALVR